MENDNKILSLIEEFADDVRKYCNGISSSNINFIVFGRNKGANFEDVFFDILLETRRYFVKSRNNPKIDDLINIKQVIVDLIFDYENNGPPHHSSYFKSLVASCEINNTSIFINTTTQLSKY